MTKFSIEYNPYLVKCIFRKNGKVLSSNSKIGAKAGERLQIILGESVNWKGLLEEIAASCDDDVVEIQFRGRRIDFEDLKYVADLYNGNVKFSLAFDETADDADVISELDQLFDEIKEKNLPEFSGKSQSGKDIYTAYEEVKNGIFEVNVIATMSSGKSTLINSLLHTELLPSQNQACTATIAQIRDCDNMEEFEAECYAEDRNTVIYPRAVVTLDEMRKYNSDERVTYIDIEGNIPSIPNKKINLCLRDTPGPNFAGNIEHGKLTQKIIKETNAVVLYIMNLTQLETKNDDELLRDISSEMKRAGKQSRDRFIFVVNKCDELDGEKGETLDKILVSVRDYLKGFNIDNPTIIPACARMALVIRKDRKGEKLTRSEQKALKDIHDIVELDFLHYENYATMTPTVRKRIQSMVEQYHADEETWDQEALIHTGIPVVEETICEYIDKYAYPMKINDAVKDIVTILDDLDMKSRFDEKIAADDDKLKRVQAQIMKAQQEHTESKEIYEEYKNKIAQLGIDVDEDNEQFKVEMELERITKEYDGQEKVEKQIAIKLIDDFQKKLNDVQADCEKRLNREMDEKIFRKCEEMLEEYKMMTRKVLEKIDIENYDFNKKLSLGNIRISNIDDIMRRNESIHYKEVEKWKENPKRAGFWGKFKFWAPKEISYYDKVRDGMDVNVNNVIMDTMAIFSASIKENINEMFDQALRQINEYKEVFNDNIDRLASEIDRILDELRKSTAEKRDIEQRVESNRELAKWIAEKEEKLRTILSLYEEVS